MSLLWEDIKILAHDFFVRSHDWILTSGLRIVLYLLLGIAFMRLIRSIKLRFKCKLEEHDKVACEERDKRLQTIAQVVGITSKIFIWLIIAIMILRELGANIAPLLAGAGVAGIAIGFGAQSIIKDILNGFFILLENQFRVGDVVKIADKIGTVEFLNLRMTALRSFDGVRHIIPNGQITTVENMTFAESRALIRVAISYNSDIDKALEVLEKTLKTLSEDPVYGGHIREYQILGVDNLGESSVDIAVRIATEPKQQWFIGREFRYRIKKEFDKAGIEIPFPHRTVYIRKDKIRKQQ